MDATRPVVPERLEALLLARLALPAKTPATAAQLATLTRRFAPTTLTPPEWRALVEETFAQLQARQIVSPERRLVSPDDLQARLGPHTVKKWDDWADRLLPALALGIALGDSKSRRQLSARDGWVSAIAGRVLGIWQDGPPPSLKRLGAALVWRELGLPGAPEDCPPTLRAHFLKRHIAMKDGTPAQLVSQIALRAVRAPNAAPRTVRDALVRSWLAGDDLRTATPVSTNADHRPPSADHRPPSADSRPPSADHRPPSTDHRPPPADHRPPPPAAAPTVPPPSLIDDARSAARSAQAGVFGDRKVFISSVWSALRERPTWAALALDDFKRQLVAAHRNQQLVLTRADYVAAMDPALVAASETRTDGATFHFIERDPVR